MNELKAGQSAVITDVGGEEALRCRLLDMGLIPKTKVMVRKVAPWATP
ncbi:MAG: ferrous iron transport protein A [Muribaculaceae bacterium]|nr:ferrous iron transport protein A [Muribaculaceae bacterium]